VGGLILRHGLKNHRGEIDNDECDQQPTDKTLAALADWAVFDQVVEPELRDTGTPLRALTFR
jgi:hypothetical protein